MRRNETSETDSAPSVRPAIRHTAPWRVVGAKALDECRLRVSFVDGTEGLVEMDLFLSDPKLDGTLFEELRDPAVFGLVKVVLGAVQWPNGADLAPDAMYDAIRAGGRWVLGRPQPPL